MSVWAATSAVIMIICVGIAVDLGGQVRAQQQARDLAAQAARVGGQHLDDSAISGRYPLVAIAQAKSAAGNYLTAAEVTGTVTITDATTIRVAVTDTYSPLFLGIVGIADLTVTGDATARVIRTMGETEQ
ncbi:pilus assembly protein [Pengzhenrongella sicca]|uniref:Pilus assembly protein n=1 Tax=Pengzhenrongella sicca TaxID=2819238 RepID=A0A8A4ZPJ1_9MICO|nr:pilus assembly protein [Pengzhenrongella sicca]